MKNNELKLIKEKINLKKISEHVIKSCIPLIDSNKLHLINNIPDDLPFVYADETRLEQILINLLDNAIKFTENGKIELSAVLESPMIKVIIEDTGIGIPSDKFDDIFNAFQQIDMTSTRKYGGTGIGLFLVKKLVEMQGGKIWLESAVSKGSKFFFTIPIIEKD
jgi:signal transduction histidine kinase